MKLIRLITFTMLLIGGTSALAQVSVQHLRTEMLVNPMGIDVAAPRLSWEISSTVRDTRQTAYQILVASSPEKLKENQGDLWDSGLVSADESINLLYKGKALKSRMYAYWKVKVSTNQGHTEWSAPAFWSMGLMNYVDWKGRWIGLDKSFPWDNEGQFSRLSARYFRKDFTAKKAVKKATVYIIGLGMYELYINGHKIGDQVLAPVPTDYNAGVKYNVFDVTAQLKTGANAIGTVLGNGRFYTMRQDYKPYKIKTFGYPKMRLNLDITYDDGSQESIVTDDSWKVTADGPIRTNNEYDGESYDATKEMAGWNQPGYQAQNWLKAQFVQEAEGMPEAQMTANMKVMETLKPIAMRQLKPGVFILDMGQNMAGWVRMRVKGVRGTKVKLRFAESLLPDGSLYVENLRDAKVTDEYTLKGGLAESWEPSFVYHGFRYVEITGYPGVPKITDFDGRVVYDEMQTTGAFKTSNTTINQVYHNAYWGIRSNYKGMPVDCPQRNERQPWLGDRTTGAYGEAFIFDNSRLYAKWLDDIQQAQKADGSIPDVAPAFWRYYGDNVTWPGTYLSVAEMLYQQYADAAPIAKHYPSMKKWMDYMQAKYMEANLITKDKYGDWCVPPESKELIHSRDPNRNTNPVLIASATYYRMLYLMQHFAQILGQEKDVQAYQALAEKLKTAFNSKFLDPKTLAYDNSTVTANLLPLAYGLVPEGQSVAVFNHIVDKTMNENKGHISTGVIGTQWLMRGLTQYGRPDIAYQLASNRTYPSWGYMAENGATTIWELWNGNTASPKMNSQNHVMLLGDLIIWYYENLAGIKAAAPGFKKIQMAPEMIQGLDSVDASYQSVRGEINSKWVNTAAGFRWNIRIPANTTARISIPASSENRVQEGTGLAAKATGVKFVKMEAGKAVYEISSGDYAFSVKP